MTYPTFYEYKKAMDTMFASYGFMVNPFDYTELTTLWHYGADLDTCYAVGCDVNSGFSFHESYMANK